MTAFRRLFRDCQGLAVAIVALALAMKLLVPAGFMPILDDGRIIVAACSGTGPVTPMAAGMAGMAHHAPKAPAKHDQGASAPCAYAGLMAPSLAAVDPLLLALAVLIAISLALRRPVRPLVAAPVRWRPPLRGPPRPA